MTTARPETPAEVTRRRWVRDAVLGGAVVAAGAGLAGCTSSGVRPPGQAAGGGGGSAVVPGTGQAGPSATGTARSTPRPSVSKLPTAPAGAPEENTTETFHSVHLGKTSAIPVGGGVVYRKQGVVVTQPTAGVYQCFSASCTHLGCVVAKVAAGLIQCPCHGARFSIVDGSVKAGPAPRGLTRQGFSVQDGVIELD